jgi:Protein of unknown function (DUF1592)/Protein of unknown function (DUF1588)/Protein of unknown function (DUF1587)/Protein of unknown function (DUF1595)/Protein of unknown function (DUF1585)
VRSIKQATTTIATIAAALALGGCYEGLDGFGNGPFGVGDDTGSGGSAGSDEGESESEGEGPLACEQGSPGPRVLRLLTRREYAATVSDLLGVEPPPIDEIPTEPLVDGYDNDAPASVVTARHVDAYMQLAELVADQAVTQSAATLVGCMPEDPECPRLFVETLGRRALRRPLSGEEVDLYVDLFDPAVTEGDFYEGVRLVVRGLLMNPELLYRTELGEPEGDEGLYRLTGYEVASALSYGFWGTMPDEELLAAAAAGELDDAAGREAQARRLLDDPRGRVQMNEFITQWIGTGPLLQANKDAVIYPGFTSELREAMAAEQAAFVEHVLYEGSATLQELLQADYVLVNDALAAFYGLPLPGSDVPVRVELPAGSQRGGLLMLGSVLASHAHPNESSPVKRGVFVRERLLCQELPSPPPDVDATPPELDPNATTRERFGQHSADPACKGCHELIDPLGFGFEAYDGVGAFRATENGLPIDATGSVNQLEPGAAPVPFDGPAELAAILAEARTTNACAVHHWLRFTAGRDITADDACTVETLTDQLVANGGDLHELLVDSVLLDSFVYRQDLQGQD